MLEIEIHGGGTVAMTARPRNFPSPVDAAIFDFDETMIDLERQHAAAAERLCRAMGSDYHEMNESFRTWSGRRVIDDIRDMRELFGWQRSVGDLLAERQRYFDEEIETSNDLQLMRGVERFVHALHERRLRLAIASSAVRKSIEMILRRFKLLQFFEVIVDGSEVERGKPDPQAFVITAQRLRADASRCVVFEDSTAGVRAAKTAGMFCIAVRNPHAQTLQDLRPADWIASSFDDVDESWFATSSPS